MSVIIAGEVVVDRSYTTKSSGLLSKCPIVDWVKTTTTTTSAAIGGALPSPTGATNALDGSLRFKEVSEAEVAEIAALKAHAVIAPIYVPSKHSDAMLLRFIIGMQHDLEVASASLERAIKWKKEKDIERMWAGPLTPGEAAFKLYHTAQWHGVGHNHHPIFFDRIGRSNRKEFFKVVSDEDVSLRYARVQEIGLMLASDISSVLHEHIDSFIFVFDLEGMGMTDAANSSVINMFKAAVSLMQNVYVGSLHHLFIINAPALFTGIWKVLSNFIDAKSQKKMEIIGYKYRDRLLEFMPESSIPKYLKGACTLCGEESPDCIPLALRPKSAEPAPGPRPKSADQARPASPPTDG